MPSNDSVCMNDEWGTPYIIIVSILAMIAIITTVGFIRKILKSRGVLPSLTESCAVTTIVMVVVETGQDRIVLPIKTFTKLQLQNGCCLARLLVDWGKGGHSCIIHEPHWWCLPYVSKNMSTYENCPYLP